MRLAVVVLGSAAFFAMQACSKSGPEGPDTLTLKADKTTVPDDQKSAATLTITASNSDSKPLPTSIVVTLTVIGTSGFLETSGTESETVTLANGTGTAHFYCSGNATVAIKATVTTPTGNSANKTIGIVCGTGGTGASSGGGGSDTKSALSLTATPSPVNEGGSVSVSATVLDVSGAPVADGTAVIFSTTFGFFGTAGSTASVLTAGGKGIATTTLTAPKDSGIATITANFTDSTSTTRTGTTNITVVDPGAYSIKVSATTTDLSTIGASTTLTATLYCGQSPTDGSFDVSLIGPNNIGTFSLQTPNGTLASDGRSISGATTSADDVIVDFTSGVIGGAALVTFSYAGSSDCRPGASGTTPEVFTGSISLTVDRPPQLTSAQFVSVDNNTIRVKGSKAPNTAMLTFKFTDQVGGNAADGIPVTFALSPNHSQDVFLTPSATVTAGGLASTFLNAGGQAETVTVSAIATQNGVTVGAVSTSIAIVGGVPEYAHMSISCDVKNRVVTGLAFDNFVSNCTVDLGDRFGNRVDIGTEVNFRTEAGNIDNALTFDQADNEDVASETVNPTLVTAAPRPQKFLIYYAGATVANPSGSAVKGKNYAATALNAKELLAPALGGYIYPDGSEVVASDFYPGESAAPTGKPCASAQDLCATVPLIQSRGTVTFIAITQGEESFVDLNGNKIYDNNEPFIDLPEPFIDKNDNGVQDSCTDANGDRLTNLTTGLPLTDDEFYACYEDFVDLNGNGKWDDGNGVWDNYTAIWKSHTVFWTGAPVGRIFPNGTASATQWPACIPSAADPLNYSQADTAAALVHSAHLYSGNASADTCSPDDPLDTFTVAPKGFLPTTTFTLEMGDENYNCPLIGDHAWAFPPKSLPVLTGSLAAAGTVNIFQGGNEPCEYQVVVTPQATAVTAPAAGSVQAELDPPDFTGYVFTWGMSVAPGP